MSARKTRPAAKSTPRVQKARPVRPAAPQVEQTAYASTGGVTLVNPSPDETVGTSGTAIYGGIIASKERNPKLSGRTKWKTFADMIANRVEVSSSLLFYLGLGGKPTWKWPARDETPRAQQIADATTEIIGDLGMPWRRVVRSQLMFRWNGNAIDEMTAFRRKDGLIGLKVSHRPAYTVERWLRAPDGSVAWIVQRSPQDGSLRPIPRWKFLYTVTDAITDSPEGLGLLRHAVDPVDALAGYERLEAIGYENSLAGVPLSRVPLGLIAGDAKLSAAQKEARIQPFRDIASKHVRAADQGYVIESMPYKNDDGTFATGTRLYDIETLHGDASGQVPIGAAIDRKKHEIHALFGSEFLLVGAHGAGSHALSQQKMNTASLIVDGALEDVAESVFADLVSLIGTLNGWPEELWPKPAVDKLTMRDVGEVASTLRDLAAAGAPLVSNDPAVNDVREQLGVSPMPEVADAALSGARLGAAKVPPGNAPPPDDMGGA